MVDPGQLIALNLSFGTELEEREDNDSIPPAPSYCCSRDGTASNPQLIWVSAGITAEGTSNPIVRTVYQQPKDNLFSSLRAWGETSHKPRRLKALTTSHCITAVFCTGGGKLT